MVVSTVLYSLTFLIGTLCLLIPPSVAISNGKTLSRQDFGLQITLPTSIGMLLLGIAFYGFIRTTWESVNGIDERNLGILIALTAVGGICVSLMAGITSFTRMYWAAD
jgi:hypothetical protein